MFDELWDADVGDDERVVDRRHRRDGTSQVARCRPGGQGHRGTRCPAARRGGGPGRARRPACLDVEDRRVLDAELCGDVSRLDGMGDARLAAEAKAIAYRLDPQAVVDRAARAETERTVTIRPGLCEACNYAKEADGWSVTADGGGTGVQARSHDAHGRALPIDRAACAAWVMDPGPAGRRARRLTRRR
jgi:hypothetical protein